MLIADLATKYFLSVAHLIAPKRARSWRKEQRMHRTARILAGIQRGVQPGPITVVATFSASTGLAAAARRLAVALQQSGIQTHTIDVTRDFGLEAVEVWPEVPPLDGDGGTLVLCIQPPSLGKFIATRGAELFKHRRWVGWWWWELEMLPRSWCSIAEQMDEIWCASRFVYDCFARSVPGKPLHYLPLPLKPPTPSAKQLVDFALPGDKFTVLSILDLRSSMARKNPDGMIKAFLMAFGESSDVLYVLKVSGGGKYPDELAQLQSMAVGAGNIRIMTEILLERDIAAMIQSTDVVLSLHRSEGFGMVLAEAALLGIPVIATAWSGVMEFLDPSCAALVDYRFKPAGMLDSIALPKGCQWAEPDLLVAAQWLKILKADNELRQRLGAAAKMRANAQFHAGVFERYLVNLRLE